MFVHVLQLSCPLTNLLVIAALNFKGFDLISFSKGHEVMVWYIFQLDRPAFETRDKVMSTADHQMRVPHD